MLCNDFPASFVICVLALSLRKLISCFHSSHFLFWNFCSSVRYQNPHSDSIGPTASGPSAITIKSAHSSHSYISSFPPPPRPLFCLLASWQSVPNIFSSPKLQNSTWDTFMAKSWVDFSFWTPCKSIKAVSHSRGANAGDSTFYVLSHRPLLIALQIAFEEWSMWFLNNPPSQANYKFMTS